MSSSEFNSSEFNVTTFNGEPIDMADWVPNPYRTVTVEAEDRTVEVTV